MDVLERIEALAGWTLRDRREPDKVLAYQQEILRRMEHMPSFGYDGWHSAAIAVILGFQTYDEAQTPGAQAAALVNLLNYVHDLKTYLPGYDYETGTIPEELPEDE